MRHGMKSHVVDLGLLFLIAAGQLQAETTWQDVQKKGVLTVCMDVDNLPYSIRDAERPGLDIEAAQLLAEGLGVKLEFHWLNTLRESLLADMLHEHCDCVFGIPIDERAMEETIEVGKKVDFSTPYLGTGYILVAQKGQRPQSVTGLSQIKTEALAAEAGSVAADVLKQKGYNRRVYGSQIAVLNALQQGQIAYGVLWANAGWLIVNGAPDGHRAVQRPDVAYADLRLVDGYTPEPGFRWNVAVAVRKGDADLKDAINAVIQEKLTTERIKAICNKYQIPYYPPFSQTEERVD